MKKIQEIDNFTHIVSLEHLKREIEYEFNLWCSENGLRELTEKLNILEAKKASISGTLKLETNKQIILQCTVKAKIIQPCSLTLEPVVTNISKQVLRTFFIGSNSNSPFKTVIIQPETKSIYHNGAKELSTFQRAPPMPYHQ